MLCLHQQENFYPTSCLSNEKHSKGDKTMDYLANYPCSIESVSQIEKQLWHKLRNILSLNPLSIRILQVLKTRSRISKPTFITLMVLNRFFPSNKTLPTPLLTDNIKMDGRMPMKIKWKIHPLLHCISSFVGTSSNNCKIQPPDLLSLVVLY